MRNIASLELAGKYESSTSCPIAEDRRGYYMTKRILDFMIALILLVLAFLLMVLIAASIYLYSPGPIFYIQEHVGAKRVSKDKRFHWRIENFRCCKFRTMNVHADSSIHQEYIKALIENDQEQMIALQNAPTHPIRPRTRKKSWEIPQDVPTQPRKLVNDSRVITPGKILRKSSLDELPQLWNIVRGDMSLVGPRPAIPYEVEMYKPWHLQRLQAQPGLSGLQQVTARCIADFDDQVQLDIDYIERQSLWLDIQIILKTPFAVLTAKGAY